MECSPREVADRLAKGEQLMLFDCRPTEERAIASIEGSIHAPLNELSSRLESLYEHEDLDIVVYCHHGIRSRQAVAILLEAGFASVQSMRGGIDLWSMEVDETVRRY